MIICVQLYAVLNLHYCYVKLIVHLGRIIMVLIIISNCKYMLTYRQNISILVTTFIHLPCNLLSTIVIFRVIIVIIHSSNFHLKQIIHTVSNPFLLSHPHLQAFVYSVITHDHRVIPTPIHAFIDLTLRAKALFYLCSMC